MRRQECGSNAMVTVQMTVEEYLEMKSRLETKEVTTKQKNLVYGLEGIKTLFGCSTTTAWRIKKISKPINAQKTHTINQLGETWFMMSTILNYQSIMLITLTLHWLNTIVLPMKNSTSS